MPRNAYNERRMNYRKRLEEARDNFLSVLYESDYSDHNISMKDLICVVIAQNLELLFHARKNGNGRGKYAEYKSKPPRTLDEKTELLKLISDDAQNLNLRANVNLTNIDKTLHQSEE